MNLWRSAKSKFRWNALIIPAELYGSLSLDWRQIQQSLHQRLSNYKSNLKIISETGLHLTTDTHFVNLATKWSCASKI